MANGCTVSATATTTKISVTAKATYTGTTYSNYEQDWKITVANVGSKTGTITLPRGGSPRSFSASFNVSASPNSRKFNVTAWWDSSWSSAGGSTTATTTVTVPAVQRDPHGQPTVSVSKSVVQSVEQVTISWKKSSDQGNASFERFELYQGNTKLYSGTDTSYKVKPSDYTGAGGGKVTFTVREVHEWYGTYPYTSASVTVTVRPTFTYYNSTGSKTYCRIFAYSSSGDLKNVIVYAYNSSGELKDVSQ